MRQVAVSEFGNDPIDLVIDDASHELERTRASFEALFPLLRPGGLYVIEDWNWEHVFHDAVRGLMDDDTQHQRLRASVRDSLEGWTSEIAIKALRSHIAFALLDDDASWRGLVVDGLLSVLRDPNAAMHAELRRQFEAAALSSGFLKNGDDLAKACGDQTHVHHRAACNLVAQRMLAAESGKPWRPLSRLAVELLLMRASGVRDVVRSISVDKHWIVVTRGDEAVDPATFRIADAQASSWGLFGDRAT